MSRLHFPEGRLDLVDVPTTVEELLPGENIALLRNLLTQFEIDARLLPSLRAAQRCLDQADAHLRACVALAENIDQGVN